jgi:hypothetical protein
MPSIFKSSVSQNVGTSPVAIYTAPAVTTTTLIGLTIANTGSTQIAVDVTLQKGATTVFMVKQAPVPVGGAFVAVGGDQKVVMQTADILRVTSNTATSADVIVSYLEIT